MADKLHFSLVSPEKSSRSGATSEKWSLSAT